MTAYSLSADRSFRVNLRDEPPLATFEMFFFLQFLSSLFSLTSFTMKKSDHDLLNGFCFAQLVRHILRVVSPYNKVNLARAKFTRSVPRYLPLVATHRFRIYNTYNQTNQKTDTPSFRLKCLTVLHYNYLLSVILKRHSTLQRTSN